MTTPSGPALRPDPTEAGAGRDVDRRSHLQRGREPARSRRRSCRPCLARRSSSWTTVRPTAPAGWPMGSPPPSRGCGSATGRPSRASDGPISTGSRSLSTAGPRPSSRWMPTGRTIRGAAIPRRARGRETADLVIGSRYTPAAAWSTGASAGGSSAAAAASSPGSSWAWPARPHRRVQGVAGIDPGAIPFEGIHAGGYVFQIEMTFRATARRPHRRGPDHLPRPTRGLSKMSRRIVVEALIVVVQLRAEALGRGPAAGRRRAPWQASRRAARRGTAGRPDADARPRLDVSPPAARLGSTVEPEPPPGVRVVLDVRPLQEPDRAPLTAGLPRRAARCVRRRAARRRIVRAPPALGSRRPDDALRPPRGRRPATAPADPSAPLGRPDGRCVRAQRSLGRGRVAGRRGRRRGRGVSRGRWGRAARDRAAAGRDPPRSRAVGAPERLSAQPREPVRPAAPGRLLRDAAAVIVGTETVALAARRLLHLRRERLRVIPHAPRRAFAFWPGDGAGPTTAATDRAAARAERERLGLPERYLVYSGRYDARQDLASLLRAIEQLAAGGRPDDLAAGVPWPPRVLLVGASPDDRASLARAASRVDVGETLSTRRACPTSAWPARPRRPGSHPAGLVGRDRHGSARVDRVRDPGHRLRRRRPAGDRRPGRDPRPTTGTRAPGVGPRDGLDRGRGPRSARRDRPRAGRDRAQDVGRCGRRDAPRVRRGRRSARPDRRTLDRAHPVPEHVRCDGLARAERDEVGRLHHLDERLADRQHHRFPGPVVELGRALERGLLPGDLGP